MMKIRHTIAAFALCAVTAAQSFSALAQNIEELCRPLYSEEFCARDLEKIEALRPLAEKGSAAAQFRLGLEIRHASFFYIESKEEEALRESGHWYRKAAEQGYALAELQLGNYYSLGWGVAKDRREALRWWRKAAEQGLVTAQYSLGDSYATGNGVDMDKQEAVRWWRKAAEQGYEEAQMNLSRAYMALDEGVETDEREAYIWLSIAAENGNAVAQIRSSAMIGALTCPSPRSAPPEKKRNGD